MQRCTDENCSPKTVAESGTAQLLTIELAPYKRLKIETPACVEQLLARLDLLLENRDFLFEWENHFNTDGGVDDVLDWLTGKSDERPEFCRLSQCEECDEGDTEEGRCKVCEGTGVVRDA